GANFPIRVQTMTNTSTNDIEASVEQCKRVAMAGAQYVRLTAQGVKEAQNIGVIRQELRRQGFTIPLVADIHFNPKAAFEAARVTDKVRINPGNFVDPARTFKTLEYTDEEYNRELQRIEDALVPFIDLCRSHNTAVRLGVNHGSLSDRIMSRYGNTAAGMVESVMEFLRIMVKHDFNQIVISMKASNVVVMIEAVRRLVAAMDAEDMHFPLHLGVTEAGFGQDGRIKSAVGIGTLLAEGLGDTIRVSLSEEPEAEVPVAEKLVNYIALRENHTPIPNAEFDISPICPTRRISTNVHNIGGKSQPIVVASCAPTELNGKLKPDFFYSPDGMTDDEHDFIVPQHLYEGKANTYPICTIKSWDDNVKSSMKWIVLDAETPIEDLLFLSKYNNVVIVATTSHVNVSGALQTFCHNLTKAGITCPVVTKVSYSDTDSELLQVKAGTDLGTIVSNGCRDGIWLETPEYNEPDNVVQWEFAILQAARLRISQTEFISCPSCGRTMFDLMSTVRRVKEATSHLTHLKIAVMGCVVNGPGEMADADYGYVGAARNRISLYKGKECVEKNIPEEEAIPRLIQLIKDNNDWHNP
ncbi:MAG: (E)-4-hydroxy-3-methylbut-2-enyl-diphosphate synthase, partial [Muribaculaceae bacterium]|nr:(E)-4-hydroxy-3-methylbut-2-enyl-diphosphate synthase [Muribaculaceae bacterium]